MQVPEKFKDHMQISNSRREKFMSCPRKYYWAYEHEKIGVEPMYGSTALRYGRVWHFALQAYYDFIKEHGWEGKNEFGETVYEYAKRMAKALWEEETDARTFFDDHRTFENLVNALSGYMDKWMEERAYLEVISTEKDFFIEIELTDEEKEHFPYLAKQKLIGTGIIDLVAAIHRQVWIFEHKTTGTWMTSVLATLQRSAQTQWYHDNADKIVDDEIQGVMVNLHHLSAYKKKDGTYGATKIEFERDPQIYSDADLKACRQSFLHVADMIAREKERGIWPMNLDTCYKFNKQCEFTNLCQQNKPFNETNTEGFIMRRDI